MKVDPSAAGSRLLRLWTLVERLVLGLTVVALWSIVGLVVAQVGLRYLFGIGLPWSAELARFLHIAIVFVGLIFVFRSNSHIAVDFIFHKLPTSLKKGIHLWNLALQIALSLAVVLGAIRVFQDLWAVRSPALRMPTGLFFFPTAFGFLLLAAVVLAYAVRFVVKGDDEAIAEQEFDDEEREMDRVT